MTKREVHKEILLPTDRRRLQLLRVKEPRNPGVHSPPRSDQTRQRLRLETLLGDWRPTKLQGPQPVGVYLIAVFRDH